MNQTRFELWSISISYALDGLPATEFDNRYFTCFSQFFFHSHRMRRREHQNHRERRFSIKSFRGQGKTRKFNAIKLKRKFLWILFWPGKFLEVKIRSWWNIYYNVTLPHVRVYRLKIFYRIYTRNIETSVPCNRVE